MRRHLSILLICCTSIVLAACSEAEYQPDLTEWGTPNIEGVWDFRTLTPFERPPEFADKAVLTPREARAFQDADPSSFLPSDPESLGRACSKVHDCSRVKWRAVVVPE